MPYHQERFAAFFDDLARAFAQGDMCTATSPFCTPATVMVANKELYVHDLDQARAMLLLYRDNLLVEGYDCTRATLHHVETARSGETRVLLTWTHFNTSGADISHLDLCYFLQPIADSWVITKIEVASVPKPRLAAGLPIH